MQKLTPWQRLCSATPQFFKRVQALALGIAGLGGTLATIHGVPTSLTASMISAGTAVAAIAQFAVKQIETDNSTTNENK